MSPGLPHVIKAGVSQAPDVAPAVAAKDDNDSLAHNTAHRNPLQPVHTGEKVRYSHQQVGAVDLIEPGKGPAAPAVGKTAEGARKKWQPVTQVFAAHNAPQQVVVRMA